MSGSRYTGSGRARESGFAAVHRHDFKVHTDGTDFRHTADQTDMNLPLSLFNGSISDPTVQGTLEKIALLIQQRGHGWVCIGDGYSLGDYNVDPGTTLQQAFADAFTNPRLVNGGVILVKAGTYRLTNTVDVPKGITIIGEPAGTHIIGSMNEKPMFYINKSIDLFSQGTISAVEYHAENTVDTNMFYNIILSDNIDGYLLDGFSEPKATMATVPMIQCAYGSHLICERVTFLGRLSNTSPPITMTRWAVSYDGTSTAPSFPTTLECLDCYFDGQAVPIEFNPTEGAKDQLKVIGCRAKTGSASLAQSARCFINTNLCNVEVSGNYHVGDTTLGASTFLYITNNAVIDADVRVSVVGNRGGLTTTTSNYLFANQNTNTFLCAVFGNSWGENYSNPWSVTVGDGSSSIGDINGAGAIDLALQRAALSFATDTRRTQVVVGYGTYSVTAGGMSNFVDLIGLERNGLLPVLELNSPTDTDEAGNKTTSFGPYIKNIKFTSAAGAATYNTITVNYSNGSGTDSDSLVENCYFLNAGVVYPVIARGATDKIRIALRDCKFNQTGTYADNFNLLVTPAADVIELSRCRTLGKGYVGGIGQVSGLGYTPTVAYNPVIKIDQCIFDEGTGSGGTVSNAITAASPLTGYNNYFFVNLSTAKLFITDSKFLCSAETHNNPIAVIGGGMPAAGTFKQYIKLYCQEIFIDNTMVMAPDQRYTSGGIDYSIAGVFAEPTERICVSNSRLKGSCALQLSGANLFTYYEKSSAHITNSELCGFAHGSATSTVSLDIDAPKYSGADNPPSIIIDGCNIDNQFSATNVAVEHTNIIATYTALGIAQIYAQGWVVRISNSMVNGRLDTNYPAGFAGLVGLFVDTLGDETGTLDDANILITNCETRLKNDVSTGSPLNQSFSCMLSGKNVNVSNNVFSFVTSATGGTNIRSIAYFIADGYGEVIGNNFIRSGELASAAVLFSGNGSGLFVDNAFNEPTFNGVSTVLMYDISSEPWIKERNINQTDAITITSSTGVYDIDTISLGYTGTSHDFQMIVGSGTMQVIALASAASTACSWSVDLTSVLPKDCYVVSASVVVSGAVGGGAAYRASDDVQLMLFNGTSGLDVGNSVAMPGSGISSVNTAIPRDYRVNYTQYPRLSVVATVGELNGATATTTTIGPLVVTFRW